MNYKEVQLIGKQTIEFIKGAIRPGMKLEEVRRQCEEKMLELGADSFWYWDIGAFIFSGDETAISISGKNYKTADKLIQKNDIVTIDLSPQWKNIWGDYARTIIIEDGKVVNEIDSIRNKEWQEGLLMEQKLHRELSDYINENTTFEDLFYHMNAMIISEGFINLDFLGNLGHSIEKKVMTAYTLKRAIKINLVILRILHLNHTFQSRDRYMDIKWKIFIILKMDY